MRAHRGHFRECAVDTFARSVMLDEAMRLGPAQRCADSAAQLTGFLWYFRPDRGEHAKHILAPDPVDLPVAQDVQDMARERSVPVLLGRLTTPAVSDVR